jgi:hypothetical protein
MPESKPARPVPRRRPPDITCAECGYSLQGASNLTCPECGTQRSFSTSNRIAEELLTRRERLSAAINGLFFFLATIVVLCCARVIPASWVPFGLISPGPGSTFGMIAGGAVALMCIVFGSILGWPAMSGRRSPSAEQLNEFFSRDTGSAD